MRRWWGNLRVKLLCPRIRARVCWQMCVFSSCCERASERESGENQNKRRSSKLWREKHFSDTCPFRRVVQALLDERRTHCFGAKEKERNRMEEPFQSRSSSTWPGAWLSGLDSPPWPLLCCRSSSSGHVTSLHCSTLLCLQRTPNSCPPSNFCFCCDTEITRRADVLFPPPHHHHRTTVIHILNRERARILVNQLRSLSHHSIDLLHTL